MKIFFDTNVYVAEALLGDAAARILEATSKASWRIFSSRYVLAEIERVMVERLGFPRRFAVLTSRRVRRRATLVEPVPSRHQVPTDPADSPILQAALEAGADYLVTNDADLLALSPYEGLKVLSMSNYYRLLQDRSQPLMMGSEGAPSAELEVDGGRRNLREYAMRVEARPEL